jgi:flagellar motor protein MotB
MKALRKLVSSKNKKLAKSEPIVISEDDEVVFVGEISNTQSCSNVKVKVEPGTEVSGNIVYELIEEEGKEGEEEEEEEDEVEEEEEEGNEEEEEGNEEEEGEEEEGNEEEEGEEEEEEEEEREEEESLQVVEEEEVYEILIQEKKYFTTNEKNGVIYAIDADGDVGDEVGLFVNGKAKLRV